MKYTWSILDISAKDGLITHAKYKVELSDQDQIVETEGNWWFQGTEIKVPFDQVTEEMVASWIEQETMKDGVNLIKSRLEEQLNAIKNRKTVVAPWLPQVFTPNI
jgi:ribosome-associated translation inhibitor RaiA